MLSGQLIRYNNMRIKIAMVIPYHAKRRVHSYFVDVEYLIQGFMMIQWFLLTVLSILVAYTVSNINSIFLRCEYTECFICRLQRKNECPVIMKPLLWCSNTYRYPRTWYDTAHPMPEIRLGNSQHAWVLATECILIFVQHDRMNYVSEDDPLHR